MDLVFQCIREEISNEFKRHKYIIESDVLKTEKEHFMKIVNNDKDMSLYITALKFLSDCLNKYHNEKVIILIDEYEVPLENAFFEGVYKEMIGFIRSLFESALKTNSSLEFSVITGCLRISKESIFRSDLFIKSVSIIYLCLKNSFEISSLIQDRKYDMELRSEGYKNIFKYGIAFYKKDCLIKIKD